MSEFQCEQSIGEGEAAGKECVKPRIIKYGRVWSWICRSNCLVLEVMANCWGKYWWVSPETVCTQQNLQWLLSKDMSVAMHPLPGSWAGRAKETEAQSANDSSPKFIVRRKKQVSQPPGPGLYYIPQISKRRVQKSHCWQRSQQKHEVRCPVTFLQQ